ncbi:MAG TPA: tripartite tricarboxylate transporter substrate binding protein [Burkholderiales bacterium]|nr:tripartite tricarboxylate transporter substrate binding protein [Burkholderiales bacterium]
MKRISRALLPFAAVVTSGMLCSAVPAMAQQYPAKSVRWVVPFPPGGGTDLISRTVALKLSELWGTQVLPDNRPGGGGTIGLAAAAKAPADGYTIVLGQASNVSVAPGLYAKLPYDPLKDLAPVTQVIAAPLVVVSHPSFPAKNMRDLVSRARAKPGAITFGSPGNGTIGHLCLELLKSMTHIDMLHIPYTGASRALTELMGGQIVIYASSMPPAVPLIHAGKLKALGVTTAKRLAPLPDVPTVAEGGVTGYEAVNWYGVFVPTGVPKDIVGRLHTDVVKVLKQPDVQARFASEGGDIVANTPEEFAAFIRRDIPKWTKVIKEAGAKVD